jgi:hypothetical protein
MAEFLVFCHSLARQVNSDIPSEAEHFDRLIPLENHAVIKVVGSIIRYSIGFQAKHGRRRQQATLA